MQVIITYSEYVFPFNENKKYSPGDNRSDGSIQRKAPAGPPGGWRTGQEPVLPGMRDIGWCLLKRKMK